MTPHNQAFPGVARILWVMEQLRDPINGCPWDKEQTFETIIPYTIEEAYEVADAIVQGDLADVKDELGDLLFQVVFYARLGEEQQAFDFDAIADQVADKLIRRHPHVFGDATFHTEAELSKNWESIKQQERKAKGQSQDQSILANISSGLPPMKRAVKLQKRCGKVGFDWPEKRAVAAKIEEEVHEVLEATEHKSQVDVEEEIGDLLFAVLNLARHCQVEPELALIKANNKFEQRFRTLEQLAAPEKAEQLNLAQLEALWQQVKSQEAADK